MPIVATGKDNVLTHRSAVSTLQNAGCCVVIGAVPRTLFMVDLIISKSYPKVKKNIFKKTSKCPRTWTFDR